MGSKLSLYAELLSKETDIIPKRKTIEAPKEVAPIILPSDAKLITLANISSETKDIVGVYNLSNYRRRQVAVILSPDLRVEIDKLMFETGGLLECEATL